MKLIFLTTGLCLLLAACNGDSNDANSSGSSLPPPSTSTFDYTHYISFPPQPTNISGYWLVIARYEQSNNLINNELDKRYVEHAFLMVITDRGYGTGIMASSGNPNINPFLPFTNPHIFTWDNNHLGWYDISSTTFIHLYFDNTDLMQGDVEKHHPYSDNIKTVNSEVFAIKLAELPAGQDPDIYGFYALESDTFGTFSYTIQSLPSDDPYSQTLAMAGNIQGFNIIKQEFQKYDGNNKLLSTATIETNSILFNQDGLTREIQAGFNNTVNSGEEPICNRFATIMTETESTTFLNLNQSEDCLSLLPSINFVSNPLDGYEADFQITDTDSGTTEYSADGAFIIRLNDFFKP